MSWSIKLGALLLAVNLIQASLALESVGAPACRRHAYATVDYQDYRWHSRKSGKSSAVEQSQKRGSRTSISLEKNETRKFLLSSNHGSASDSKEKTAGVANDNSQAEQSQKTPPANTEVSAPPIKKEQAGNCEAKESKALENTNISSNSQAIKLVQDQQYANITDTSLMPRRLRVILMAIYFGSLALLIAMSCRWLSSIWRDSH